MEDNGRNIVSQGLFADELNTCMYFTLFSREGHCLYEMLHSADFHKIGLGS